MSSVIATQSFEERVYEKIRTDIGSLMSDKELKSLVETAIERMFFKDRVIPSNNSWGRDERKPPLIQEIVQKACEKQITHHVEQYVAQHSDLINGIMKKTLEDGMLKTAVRSLESLISPSMSTFQSNVLAAILNLKSQGNIL